MKNFLCSPNQSILQALELMKKNGKNIVFIADKNKKLLGVLTDGDVRRLLLTGSNLSQQVGKVMNKKFTFLRQGQPVSELALNPKIKIIPVVNRRGVLTGIKTPKNSHVAVASPTLNSNEFKYLLDAFLSTWISSSGEYISRFEKNFAKFCGTKYAVAVSNGTAALHLALAALDIKKGDEVIVPDLTFAATINAVLYTGATPVIVDVEREFWTIDPVQIEKAITKKTKAIIPVHLYGQVCHMKKIMEIARKHRLLVIEDAAQAHGARFAGKKTGSFGDVGCFSFFGNKVMTTGEGGMCTTNSKTLYEKIRLLRDHGMSRTKKYWHDVIGFNYRMTNLQAAIGCAQLEKIDSKLRLHVQLEAAYRKALQNVSSLEFQKMEAGPRKKITWLVSILITKGKRDEYLKKLASLGIDARPFFYPLSSMPLYRKYARRKTPNSAYISARGINLPTQDAVSSANIRTIKEIFNHD